jgi:hypothetical protein
MLHLRGTGILFVIKGVFVGTSMEDLFKLKVLGNNNRIFCMVPIFRIDPRTMMMDMGGAL